MALALFGSADASFAVETIDTTIDTTANHNRRNNGWPVFEEFKLVAQTLTMASQRGELISDLQDDLNVKFRAFLRDWKRSGFPEDFFSA